MKEKREILSALLEKYENSKHLTEPGSSSRRVMLRMEKKELLGYDYQTAEIRDRFHQAAKELEESGFVELEWFSQRMILERIILRLENVWEVYAFLNRIHPKQEAEQFCMQIQSGLSQVQSAWILAWGEEVCKRAKETYRIPVYCKNQKHTEALLQAFLVYDALKGEVITMRAFSIRCFQDSKYFEREVRNEFLQIAQQYHEELKELCKQQKIGTREKLTFLGIYPRPELYELAGNCRILTEQGEMDVFAMQPWGIALSAMSVGQIKAIAFDKIQRVIFIENKTNYDEYLLTELHAEELAIYHGGFLSPKKREFFQKLMKDSKETTVFYFWGDIDLGGFHMFQCLQKIIPRLQPMRMSEADFMKYKELGLARSSEYLANLEEKKEAYPLFSAVIERILEYGVTIEQESFLS